MNILQRRLFKTVGETIIIASLYIAPAALHNLDKPGYNSGSVLSS
nr:MAG TPA: hypothetical protein [Caudoviricetes sp.]